MSPEEQYHQASARAEQRKAIFRSSAAAAKARVAPARLADDAKQKAIDGFRQGRAALVAKAQERPIATGAAAGAFTLYLFRRPLSALFRRLYVRITNCPSETSETDDG